MGFFGGGGFSLCFFFFFFFLFFFGNVFFFFSRGGGGGGNSKRVKIQLRLLKNLFRQNHKLQPNFDQTPFRELTFVHADFLRGRGIGNMENTLY